MDVWDDATTPLEVPGMPRRPARRAPITADLNVWLECYGKLAAGLCARFPEKSPQLWAYQTTIIRAARNYETGAWVAYDCQYRREALAAKSLDCSTPNHRLYSETFTGRAKIFPRCNICLSDAHLANQCPSNPNPFAAWWGTESCRQPGPSSQWPLRAPGANRGQQQSACRNYNENRYMYPRCRYTHQCLECSQPHPYAHCPRNPSSKPYNRPRSSAKYQHLPPTHCFTLAAFASTQASSVH